MYLISAKELLQMRVDDIDKNLKVDKEIDKTGLRFYRFDDSPFKLYGGFTRGEDGGLYRLPREIAEKTNQGVLMLCTNTAGGRVKFRTDSQRVAIIAVYGSCIGRMPHFPLTGSVGLDLYEGKTFLGGFVPPFDMPSKAYESVITIPGERGERELTVNLPLYSDLTDLYIGIEEDASLSAAAPYKYEKPVVYYGSSITQGGCASRPGSAYEAHISRWLGCDHINLGFSGSARGEQSVAEYIAGLDMSVFVFDYDHNAPDAAHLEATHLPFLRTVRAAHPTLPIIIMTKPNDTLIEDRKIRRSVIKKSYDTLISEGDENIYFLDPTERFPFDGDEGTVEGCHPTDLGFYFMAKALYDILKDIIE